MRGPSRARQPYLKLGNKPYRARQEPRPPTGTSPPIWLRPVAALSPFRLVRNCLIRFQGRDRLLALAVCNIEQTHKNPEAFRFALRERESFVRWPSKAVDRTTCRSSMALEGHRTKDLCVCSCADIYVGQPRRGCHAAVQRPGTSAAQISSSAQAVIWF